MPYFDVKLKGIEGPERIEAENLEAARRTADGEWGGGMGIPSEVESVAHAPCCRSCGSENFREWSLVDVGAGVTVTGYNELGEIDFAYDGDSRSADGGEHDEFWCTNCEDSAVSLEELCGLPRFANHACPTCGDDEQSVHVKSERVYAGVRVTEDGEVVYGQWADAGEVSSEVLYLRCPNQHTYPPYDHRLPIPAATKEA